MTHSSSRAWIRHGVIALTSIFIAAGCSSLPSDSTQPAPVVATQAGAQIQFERLYNSSDYAARGVGPTRWLADGSGYTVLENATDGGQDLVRYHPETQQRTLLVAAADLRPSTDAEPLSIADYSWSEDGQKLLIFTNTKRSWRTHTLGDYWVFDLKTKQLQQLGGNAEPSTLQFAKFDPQAKRVAYVMKNNIYVEDLASKRITALTKDGNDTIVNGTFDWVNEEEFFLRDGFRWSPDGQSIAYWQLDTAGTPLFTMINNTDSLYPTLKQFPYPKVGETNASMRIGVMPASGGNTTWMNVPGDPRQHYLVRMQWAGNSDSLLIQQLTRSQAVNTVFLANANSGAVQKLLDETTESWAEYVDDVQFIDEGSAFTWLSERSGFRHLYVVQRDTGRLRTITRGQWDVIEVLQINPASGWVYFIASPDTPLERYLFRASLDGSGKLERLTPAQPGTHSYQLSADANYAVHTFSDIDTMPVVDMIKLPEHQSLRIIKDNQSAQQNFDQLQRGDFEFFQVAAQDGLLLDGFLIKPADFDPSKKYPILFYVYGEPWGQTVSNSWGGERFLFHNYLAQQGYLVASIDNRGTRSPRGYEWRRSIYQQLGVVTVRDQHDALQAMLERWSFIDADRVAIWGHSGGGSQTLNALFRYPESYHLGMALAPVPDLTLYDTIYQERYSGLLPEAAASYRETSALTHAANLQGKLLLVHGTGDDNVHFQGSERLVNELIKHGKQFDYFAYPNRSHGIYEGAGTTLHLRTMMAEFLQEHLPAGAR
ncbi:MULTISPECIES: S9 family peptidase [Idiomarina]|uniref:S9 family peptidase n=1 Tax=Idiomarina TaxID=135575 RepID=UPI00129CADEA|nr:MULTISPECIES: S9 family peptidase [Idiomarina]MRJ42880.1 prolyl oligopeptidase family serine peptidase [Idiomarina sp. FeN1]NCU58431.1 prolyl oligopeptidase family serine peptidase [Idiomarina sp. FenA--70]NCU61128.1 prolyl oligopeptidase family serine peptidase [Idiomarina sp. FenBw--71]UUN13630.1 S9 family peptidase [Idiomarina loihiensis]